MYQCGSITWFFKVLKVCIHNEQTLNYALLKWMWLGLMLEVDMPNKLLHTKSEAHINVGWVLEIEPNPCGLLTTVHNHGPQQNQRANSDI